MKTLASGVALSAALWGGLYLYESPPVGQYDAIDRLVIGEIVITATYAAIVMFASRDRWTIRATGLWLFVLGIATAFGLAAWLGHVGTTPGIYPDGTVFPHQNIDPGIREGWTDLGRAFLAVAGLYIFIGLTNYAVIRWLYPHLVADALDEDFEDRRDPDNPGRRAVDKDAYAAWSREQAGGV